LKQKTLLTYRKQGFLILDGSKAGINYIDPFRGVPSSQLLPLRLSAFLFSDHSSELDVLQIKNAAPPEVEQHLSCGEGGILRSCT
jgi:hypothetical protein